MPLITEGQVIRGTYQVERFLGEGAFAEVYRVKHRFLGRQAMKVFKTVGMSIEETEEMLGEAMILSPLRHPNIVQVFEANLIETSRGNCGYFTMEYIAGGTLEDYWRSYGVNRIPIETTVEIIRQICRGIGVAHAEHPPIVHRDIKPQNILIGYDGTGLRVRVSDFGLAKRINPLTMLATSKGTISFKAPEALIDPKSDSLAGDVWSIGVTAYLLLTDQLPYPTLKREDFHAPLIPPSRFNIEFDPILEQVVYKALAIYREERYQNALEFLEALQGWEKAPTLPRKAVLSGASHETKSILGTFPTPDADDARNKIRQAIRLARDYNNLVEAADMMEEALNRMPDLRSEYEYQLSLWRKGIVY